jgi:hypothetical protein
VKWLEINKIGIRIKIKQHAKPNLMVDQTKKPKRMRNQMNGLIIIWGGTWISASSKRDESSSTEPIALPLCFKIEGDCDYLFMYGWW